MRKRISKPRTGGRSVPSAIQIRTERRIRNYAAQYYAGKFLRIEVRFRGAFCYIEAYTEPDLRIGSPPPGETREQWAEELRNTPWHLCRIGYFGNEDRWSFAWYSYASDKYEPSFLIT